MTGTPLYPTARLRLLGLNPHPVMVVACLAAVLERSGVSQEEIDRAIGDVLANGLEDIVAACRKYVQVQ